MPAEDLEREFGALRESYGRKLPELLQELAERLREARQRPHAVQQLGAARRLVHRLKGTSGSYRLDEISAELARIEQLLERVLAGAAADRSEAWCEIERLLARMRARLPGRMADAEQAGRGARSRRDAGSR